MQGSGEWGFMVSPQQLLSAVPSSPHFSCALEWGVVHSMGYNVGVCSTVILHGLPGISAPVPGACPYCPSLTFLFTLVLCTIFFWFFYPLLFSLCGAVFCPFLSTFSQVCTSLADGFTHVLWHVFGAGCVWWGTAPGLSSQRSPLEPLSCQQLDTYSLYRSSVGNAVELDHTK